MTILQAGHLERTKASVHAVLGVGAGVSALYNLSALAAREKFEPHLLIAGVLYTGLAAWEARTAVRHLRAVPRA